MIFFLWSLLLLLLLYCKYSIAFPMNPIQAMSLLFLAELLLCYLTGNIFWGWNLVQMTCGRHVDDVRATCRWHKNETSGEISLEDDICRLHIICTTALHKAYWLPCYFWFCSLNYLVQWSHDLWHSHAGTWMNQLIGHHLIIIKQPEHFGKFDRNPKGQRRKQKAMELANSTI